jgi:hypothetical protein
MVANTASGDESVSLPILMVDTDAGKPVPGVTVHGQFPGMVPPYEEHKARRAEGYKLEEWYELGWLDRAMAVANFRIDRRIEAEEYKDV